MQFSPDLSFFVLHRFIADVTCNRASMDVPSAGDQLDVTTNVSRLVASSCSSNGSRPVTVNVNRLVDLKGEVLADNICFILNLIRCDFTLKSRRLTECQLTV